MDKNDENKGSRIISTPNQLSLREQIDHLSSRVSISAISGLLLGASHAVFKGHPVPRASLQVSFSCALAATACFGIERVSSTIINNQKYEIEDETSIYLSHAVGGVVGGGLLGGIFQRRFIGGSLLFSPIMIVAAYAEIQFQDWKQEKIRKLTTER